MNDYSHILKHTRITEKASMHQGSGVYTFDVAPRATKRDIMRAVQALYKVVPRKVAIVTVPAKKVRHMRTGREGVKKGGKKAYVYLKKGETITIS
ncbi:50S ribosomal protein L23 [Candidatus Kaiserbacteria bacterium RIFCSPHIGHO2_02_FULL_54_11b]|uniref:Large ribosomal subunit protein uL23 n=1 Tax=Candidatus Kaiserbacteria bacterium RIFCSPHIGHO2_02_FULL_54_11b TaxID=1798494 RepID=A0A1F6DRD2_9BACT|nr:MAG: 50S ribosomal protein L23 [Candidatus Kaiserbacteria bacterium RIFCSPHIGHO2_02_FULL_54_11b]